ncbi:MAG TPA: hypothetical protein VGF39_13985 [Stellaceae bacterium]|jgi:hypothetical protein
MERDNDRLTYDVVEAGRLAGLGRNASYEAARSGEMPTVRIGHRLLVPKKAWDQKLNGEAAQMAPDRELEPFEEKHLPDVVGRREQTARHNARPPIRNSPGPRR